MNTVFQKYFLSKPVLTFGFLLMMSLSTQAQNQQSAMPSTDLSTDTTFKKTNTSDWSNEKISLQSNKAFSKVKHPLDTSISLLHRRQFLQPYFRDLGNSGSPISSLFFVTQNHVGPSLGYHGFDVYRFDEDSLNYYNTNRPFSYFHYELGSKLEQMASVLHTQNVKPNWNFALQYRKINSPGYYKIQRVNSDYGWLNTNYQNRGLNYQLYAGVVFNVSQNDENGGIVSDTFLTNPQFNDRKTIPVFYDDEAYSNKRSSVTNKLNDYTIFLKHAYTFGKRDTLFAADSSTYDIQMHSKFRIHHDVKFHSENFRYKDLTPDSTRFAFLFQKNFSSGDSVEMNQHWWFADNAFRLSTFLGKEGHQLEASAGIGFRYDQFATRDTTVLDKKNYFSNYLTVDLIKQALHFSDWNYAAFLKMFFTGPTAGSFQIKGHLSKELKNGWAGFALSAEQNLGNTPYNYQYFGNKFYTRSTGFNSKESVSKLSAQLNSPRWKSFISVQNYLLANYFYIDKNQQLAQYQSAFNVLQILAHKEFKAGIWFLDMEGVWQKSTADAPVRLPEWMAKARLGLEAKIFRNALKVSTGVDAFYHTDFFSYGYSPQYNRFYTQEAYKLSNKPDMSLFFNFKIKRFRAYIMLDQFNQLFWKNNFRYQNYAAQNMMFRFGFEWALLN